MLLDLSGNGKTLMIEQVHADMNKELIRVNITIETDEDDLLGGFRLVNGETKFVPGYSYRGDGKRLYSFIR